MTPDKIAKLITKYPNIFDSSFWFECNDGWYQIIDDLCHNIQAYLNEFNASEKQSLSSGPHKLSLKAVQVKEKFGGIRYYIDTEISVGAPEEATAPIYEFIRIAEQRSESTCETCGQPGTIQMKRRWMKCVCPSCAED